ncbi:MAG: hypothetical protein J2O48_01505 [Solirubrobacterales bacterium]|nr:hypothetical protein [Solirubrobacterales bacterium]
MSEQNDEPAHDVLAAEEFEVPGADPGLHQDPAHDVLAAEEFGMPSPDPELHAGRDHDPHVPPSPFGSEPVHDVLAAEEFAVPATEPHAVPPNYTPIPEPVSWASRIRAALVGSVATVVFLKLRARRRRRKRQD